MRRSFLADARVEAAHRECCAFEVAVPLGLGSEVSTSFPSVDAAKSWLARVQVWRENLRRDLRADGVPAPSNGDVRWMLLKSEFLSAEEGSSTIVCHLCKKCCAGLSRIVCLKLKPAPVMPAEARANGLWHGADPPEIQALSY